MPMMKAKTPIYRVFRMRRASTSSSGAMAQKRPARVMSIAIRMLGEPTDIALDQAEAGIDILGEDPEEIVDDAGAAHGRYRPSTRLEIVSLS